MTTERNIDENPPTTSQSQPQEEPRWAPQSEPQWAEEHDDIVEIVLQRTEQVIDALERVSRQQPYLLPTLGAIVVGLLAGWIFAGVVSARKPSRTERVRKAAQKRTRTVAGNLPSTPAMLPLAMELMKNPAIRDLTFKMVARMLRR